MELRHLRYFAILTEELNFTRAAARLHIAQPALSMQIKKLEAEIGAELLTRKGRGVRLTEAGRVFLDHARQSLAHTELGLTAARRAAAGKTGQLVIGYNSPAEFRVFPKIVPAFRKSWPAVDLAFHRLETVQIVERLRRDELDMGFVCLPIPTAGFDVQELTREPLVAVLPSDHHLASKSTVTIADLSAEPLILFPRSEDPESFRQIEELFLRARVSMNVVYELETSLSMINFVAMGVGCSILPDYVRRIHIDGIVYRPIRPSNMVKTLAVIKTKGRGELAETFYDFTVKTLRPKKSAARKPGTD